MFNLTSLFKQWHYLCWLGAIAFALTAYFSFTTFSYFQLHLANGQVEQFELPLLRASPERALTYKIEGNIVARALSGRTLRIIPDDRVISIEVNGVSVDLSNVDTNQLSDVVNGFEIDLSQHLRSGENHLSLRYWDRGSPGEMGMTIRSADNRALIFISIAILLTFAPFLFVALNHLHRTNGISKTRLCAYTLVLIGAVIKLLVIFTYNPVDHIWSDPARHWEQGIEALRIDLMASTDPILYQLYIGALAKLTLKIPLLVAFYTSVLAILTPWLWYRFLRELQPNKTSAIIGWALISLLPSWTSIYSYFMQETLLLPLLGAALWATWRCRRKETTASFVVMVIIWVLAGLTRGIAIPMAAVCCTWLWFNQPLKVSKAVFSSAILLFALGPLTIRSYHTVNQFAPHGMGHLVSIYGKSGNKEIELNTTRDGGRWTHVFGSPSTGTEPFAPFSDLKTQRTGKVVVNVDLMKGREDWEKAHNKIEMDLNKLAWITKENLIFLFFASSWPDNNQARVVDNINVHSRWVWAPAFIVMLFSFYYYRKKLKGNWMLPSVIIAWFLVQGLLPICVNEGRYRKPVEGLIIAQFILLVAAINGETRPPPSTWPGLSVIYRRKEKEKEKI